MRVDLGRFIVAGIVNIVVIELISKYDDRAADAYTFLIILMAIYIYRVQFFGGLAALIGTIEGLT